MLHFFLPLVSVQFSSVSLATQLTHSPPPHCSTLPPRHSQSSVTRGAGRAQTARVTDSTVNGPSMSAVCLAASSHASFVVATSPLTPLSRHCSRLLA